MDWGIVSLGIDHHLCPIDEIACFALDAGKLKLAREIAVKSGGVSEVFAISTCNRIEIYAVGAPSSAYEACVNAISLGGTRCPMSFLDKARALYDLDAVIHLFEVASGIDSLMIGENEILGQIKTSYAQAAESGHLGPVLNRTIQKAIQSAKWIRTNTLIGIGNTTIGAVAADLASRIFDDISEKKIFLAGSGEVGKSVAQALAARGAKNITVTSRTWENAYALSNEVGGSAIAFERLESELHRFDIAIFALSEAEGVVELGGLENVAKKRRGEPIFFIDLSVPRNIPREADKIDSVFLYDLTDLSNQANENIRLRQGEIKRAKDEIAGRAKYLWERIKKP